MKINNHTIYNTIRGNNVISKYNNSLIFILTRISISFNNIGITNHEIRLIAII